MSLQGWWFWLVVGGAASLRRLVRWSEFQKANIPYEREKKYDVHYKGIILPHKFFADFVVFDKIILEVKGVSGITDEFIAQAINYLKVSSNQLALVINFGELKLNYKRVVL